jgi:hypothetical protein
MDIESPLFTAIVFVAIGGLVLLGWWAITHGSDFRSDIDEEERRKRDDYLKR